jgi:competence protein ComFB
MEIHNISEDIVFGSVKKIFEAIRKEGNPEGLCFCEQCRLDTICFVLNRVEPLYVISNRGLTRIEQDWAGRQQTEVDIATLVYRGIRQVNHNLRPNFSHDENEPLSKESQIPSFDFPTIIGRVFDGDTFAPVIGVTVELYCNGETVPMRNSNWQNPFTLIEHTPGAYSFWPAPVPAEASDIRKTFEYSIKIESPQYETLSHFFKIPVISGLQRSHLNSTERNVKLPDLYLFKPGESEQDW